jgi:hypothetical protein
VTAPVEPLPPSSATPSTAAVDAPGWRAAAQARGYEYREQWQDPPFPGLLFRGTGDPTTATNVVECTSHANPFVAGTLTAQYTSAGGPVLSSFIAIRLNRSMPNIVLVNARRGALRQANIGMGSRQMMRLPGSFDRAFTLYCPIGAERVAAEIFTPELMQIFLESLPGGDIELCDDWMFVYDEGRRFSTPDALDRIERVGLRVQDEIVRRDFASLHESTLAESSAPTVPRMRGLQFAAVLVVSAVAAVLAGVWALVER